MVREFAAAYEKLGGTITSTTPYNEKQASYSVGGERRHGRRAGGALPRQLSGRRRDHRPRLDFAAAAPQKFLLNDGMNSHRLHRRGRRAISRTTPTAPRRAPATTASTEYFNGDYEAFSGGIKPDAPAADRSYDAGAIVALAIAKAGKGDAAAIKAAIPEVVAAGGEPIHAGKDEFAKALGLIKEGKPIKYEGVIGPVSFDQYGDITGPFRLWRIKDGEVTTVGEMSADEVEKIKSELK